MSVARLLDAWDRPERLVRVFYATNRERAGGERTAYVARDADRLEYGVATIRVAARHPVGLLDRGLEVVAIEPLSEEAFLVSVRGALDAGGGAELLAYVHGYNNSFDYAVRRTAQIASDVGTPVVPVLYAWPSHGGEWFAGLKYTYDENAAARSASMLSETLGLLATGTAGAGISVLAHSMGSRLLGDALVDLDRQGALQRRPFRQVVLAAPDVDAAVFARRYLDVTLEAAWRVTVYCAADDRALKVSRGVHGGYDRLGSCRSETIAQIERERLEIVDASNLYVDVLDHDKVTSAPQLVADLGAVIRGVPAADPSRGLLDRGTWFELPP